MTVDWRTITPADLYDADGRHPEPADLLGLLREFRDTGAIKGWWFVELLDDIEGTRLYADVWHGGRMMPAEDCGPDDVDFTGLTEPWCGCWHRDGVLALPCRLHGIGGEEVQS